MSIESVMPSNTSRRGRVDTGKGRKSIQGASWSRLLLRQGSGSRSFWGSLGKQCKDTPQICATWGWGTRVIYIRLLQSLVEGCFWGREWMIFNHFLALYLLPRQGCRNPRQLLDGKCWQMEARPNVSGCGQDTSASATFSFSVMPGSYYTHSSSSLSVF